MLHISYKLEGNNPYWQLEDADTHEVLIPFGKYINMSLNGDYIECRLQNSSYRGLIDKNENIILPFEYNWIGNPEFGEVRRLIKSQKYGLIDKEFNFLLPLEFIRIGKIKEDGEKHSCWAYRQIIDEKISGIKYYIEELLNPIEDNSIEVMTDSSDSLDNIEVMNNTETNNEFGFLDQSNEKFYQTIDLVLNTNTPIIYLTGKAGTGKTTFLRYLKENTKKQMVILAPTGVAALNAGGMTIHKFFSGIEFTPYIPNDARLRTEIPTGDPDKRSIYKCFRYRKDKIQILNSIELMVIDEISMVRCDLLDTIDRILKVFRRNNKPFGGIQTLLIGDPFQLPPVVRQEDSEILKNYYEHGFYFFNSFVFSKNNVFHIIFEKIYRQKDVRFIEILNRIRIKKETDNDIDLINSRYVIDFNPNSEDGFITLVTHNRQADSINNSKLDELEGPYHTFTAKIEGEFPESSYPVPSVLKLKKGAQVMVRRNLTDSIVNGTIGVIEDFHEDKIVFKNEAETYNIEVETWENIKYVLVNGQILIEVIGTFKQYPLQLAWAITIHKSQGLTFKNLIVDCANAFAEGQTYVALSRAKSFDGLYLKQPITHDNIIVNSHVIEFSNQYTPETMITEAITNGKADYYYKKARECFKAEQFEDCYDNLLNAMKIRNDFPTETFKRYALVLLRQILSVRDAYYAQNYILELKLTGTDHQIEAQLSQINDLNTRIQDMEENLQSMSYNELAYEAAITDLFYQNDDMESYINNLDSNVIDLLQENDILRHVIEESQEEIEELKERNHFNVWLYDEVAFAYNTLNTKYKELFLERNSQDNEIQNLRKQLEHAKEEINRLRNLPLLQRIFLKNK